MLGLFGPGPNPSAALLIDGQIIAWAEEERFNRIKTAPNSLPIKSTKWCLEYAGITLDQVDKIAYGWDCPNYITNTKDFFISQREIFSDSSIYNQLQEELYLNIYHPDRIKYQLQLGLGSLSVEHKLPEIVYFKHHECHAASAFFSSGFTEGNVITIDGSGEEVSTLLCYASNDKIEVIKSFKLPDTLGGFYATFTEFLGFRAYHDEGKVMGLSFLWRVPGGFTAESLINLYRLIQKLVSLKLTHEFRYIGDHSYGSRYH